MIVGIDTMVLIWALPKPTVKGKGATTQDVPEMQRRAKLLLGELRENGDMVVAPTIVVSEWLLGIDQANHGSFLAELQESFILAPFDAPSAALAAKLWQQVHKLPEDERPERKCLKSDMMIIATAKIAGANRFYSHERKVKRTVESAGMEYRDLPTAASNLFADCPDPPTKKKRD